MKNIRIRQEKVDKDWLWIAEKYVLFVGWEYIHHSVGGTKEECIDNVNKLNTFFYIEVK